MWQAVVINLSIAGTASAFLTNRDSQCESLLPSSTSFASGKVSVMNRIVLSMVIVGALAFGGVFASTASAHGPPTHHGHHHHHHHHGHYRPAYPIYGGYCVPYSSGYYSSYPGYYSARPQPRVGLYFGF
jgi:hypothetical protein